MMRSRQRTGVDAMAIWSRRKLLIGAGATAMGVPRGRTQGLGGRPVVVASKLDAEGGLLGSMMLQVLAQSEVPVKDRLQLGPTRIVRAALLAGEVDLYPEYTGNGAFFFGPADDPVWHSGAAAWETVRRRDAEANQVIWLDRAPANNGWAIAVRAETARRERLATLAEFGAAAARGVLRLAASAEFVESPAALPAFEKAYGFTFPRNRIVVLPGGDTAVSLRAAAQGIGGVDCGMAYGTDGAIAALGLVVMADPLGAQLVFEPAPVVRAATLQAYPAIAPVLARVFPILTLERLRTLNARVSVEGRPTAAVAAEFLREQGLLR